MHVMHVPMQTFLALSMDELKEIGIEPFAVRKKLHMAIQGDPVKYSVKNRCVLALFLYCYPFPLTLLQRRVLAVVILWEVRGLLSTHPA